MCVFHQSENFKNGTNQNRQNAASNRENGLALSPKSADQITSSPSESVSADTVVSTKPEQSLKSDNSVADTSHGSNANTNNATPRLDELSDTAREMSAGRRSAELQKQLTASNQPADQEKKTEKIDVGLANGNSSAGTGRMSREFPDEVDIRQHRGLDTYEIKVRLREQETLQSMIDKHRELKQQQLQVENAQREQPLDDEIFQRGLREQLGDGYPREEAAQSLPWNQWKLKQKSTGTDSRRVNLEQPKSAFQAVIGRNSRFSERDSQNIREFKTPRHHKVRSHERTGRSNPRDISKTFGAPSEDQQPGHETTRNQPARNSLENYSQPPAPKSANRNHEHLEIKGTQNANNSWKKQHETDWRPEERSMRGDEIFATRQENGLNRRPAEYRPLEFEQVRFSLLLELCVCYTLVGCGNLCSPYRTWTKRYLRN